jgi:hypothetical protein
MNLKLIVAILAIAAVPPATLPVRPKETIPLR